MDSYWWFVTLLNIETIKLGHECCTKVLALEMNIETIAINEMNINRDAKVC